MPTVDANQAQKACGSWGRPSRVVACLNQTVKDPQLAAASATFKGKALLFASDTVYVVRQHPIVFTLGGLALAALVLWRPRRSP